uniref:Uncharacterized protein n=1 Tax=Branchiostoma floridae TaxID=7739 RepID=C3ZFE0_BRAFL|eukprot:XP_002592683.1 hypothetical protein BRAFLDRAFT_67121 [Branchiostoma floridae]
MGYNGKYLQGMGFTLVVMGSLNIILGIAADATFASIGLVSASVTVHYISAPIWNGISVVITGVLAIRSGKKPTNEGLMVALIILGIFTILSAACCFSLNIVGWIIEARCRYYGDCNSASIALHVVNVLLSLAEIVMAFVAAIMPCCGLASSNNPVVITGFLAICSGKKPTNMRLMVALMVLGIFTILSAACCFSLGIVGFIIDSVCGQGYGRDYGSRSHHYDCSTASIALHVVNALLSLAEIVMAFVAAIMPCCGLASSNNPHNPPTKRNENIK